jgi:hypothetical protein
MKWTLIGLLAALVVVMLSVACASHHPPQYRPSRAWTHCSVVQIRGTSIFLSCPPPSYVEGPQLGWRLVEIDATTGKVRP